MANSLIEYYHETLPQFNVEAFVVLSKATSSKNIADVRRLTGSYAALFRAAMVSGGISLMDITYDQYRPEIPYRTYWEMTDKNERTDVEPTTLKIVDTNDDSKYSFDDDEGGNLEQTITAFVITVYECNWVGLKPDQRLCIIDHELAHCFAALKENKNGNEVVTALLDHDVEEFEAIMARHGPIMESRRRLYEAMDKSVKQGRLVMEGTVGAI